ncbi:recombinase family protein [Vibrio sp. T187]|uniref:recombinase family protein n=1 Tax=Vibrio TaxID=662 RepID=UPI0010C99FB9|nr:MULTISPECIES: recombinase family protein [Vibrio]MBW3696464.1 recombinase family protein [Vibrio sp. T187]
MTDFIVYGRVSSKTQLNDGKLGRNIQQSAINNTIKAHSGNVLNEYFDAGKSAYKGEHMADGGALREIYEDIQNDTYKPGTVLLMYSLDRFSRQEPFQAMHYFTGILAKGVSIWTCIKGVEKFETQKSIFPIITASIGFGTSNEESEKKSSRLKDTWLEKYDFLARGQAVKMTSYPFWITFNENHMRYDFNDFAPIAKGILNDYLNGVGRSLIVKRLNEAKTPFYTKLKKPTKPQVWTSDHLKKLFNNHAIYGRFDSKRNNVQIENAFPALITKDQFEIIQSMKRKRKGKQSDDYPNLFNGLLKCGYCSGSLTRSKSQSGSYSYYCTSAERCNTKKSLAAKTFDPVVLTFLKDLDWSFMHEETQENKPLLEARITELREAVSIMDNALDKRFDHRTFERRQNIVVQIEQLERDLLGLQTVHERYSFAVETLLSADNETRLKANKTLMFLIDKIEVFVKGLDGNGSENPFLPYAKLSFNKYKHDRQEFRLVYLNHSIAIDSHMIG